MTRKSYLAAIDSVLKPMGFTRQGKEWSRTIGTVIECVGLQVSSIAGATANLWSYDSITGDLLAEAVPQNPDVGRVHTATRIGTLMTGYDRWWKNDPNGPTELAEAIKVYAPAFFEGRRSLEDQAKLFGRAAPRWTSGNTLSRFKLAVTLYRMGEVEEACAALQNPPKTVPAAWLAEAESIRNWLGCRPKSQD